MNRWVSAEPGAAQKKLLSGRAAAVGISGADPDMAHRVDDLLLPIVKGVGSERAYEILTESLQTLGGSGFVVDYPLEQYIRDAKIDSVYESTNGAKRRKITVYGSQTRWLTTSEISDQRLTICRSHGGTAKQTVNAVAFAYRRR